MRPLTFLLLLLALSGRVQTLRAATGSILGASVSGTTTGSGQGYALDLFISGLAPGGSYNTGFASFSNYDRTSLVVTSAPKAVVTITSPGYSTSGTSNGITRRAVLHYPLRQPYPNEAAWDETDYVTLVKCRGVLSDYLYKSDVATVDVLAGFYTDGGTPNLAGSAVTVTNLSPLEYPGVIGDWAIAPYQSITQDTFTVRAMFNHPFGMNRQPIACVIFSARDEHNNTNSVTVSGVPEVYRWPAGNPTPLYSAVLNCSTFTNGDTITCNFKAFPWVGDARAVLDTENPSVANMVAKPLTMVCNRTDGRGTSVVYWAWDGNDADVIATNLANAAAAALKPAKSLTVAMIKMSNHNKAINNRTNLDGDFVYMTAGQNCLGDPVQGTPANNGSWRAAVTVMPAPGLTRSQCVLTQYSDFGLRFVGAAITRYYNLTFENTRDSFVFYGVDAADKLIVENCFYDGFPSGSTINIATYSPTNIYWIGNTVSNNMHATPVPAWLYAGNTYYSNAALGALYTVIGNRSYQATNLNATFSADSALQGQTFAFNSVFGATVIVGVADQVKTWGTAIVGNVMEKSKESADDGISAGVAAYSTNLFCANNTYMGNKFICDYNDGEHPASALAVWHVGSHFHNNLWITQPSKEDTFGLGSLRVGGWGTSMGAGSSGNVACSGVWPWEHAGVNGVIVTNYLAYDWFQYFNDASQSGNGVGTGLSYGDYRVKSTHPTFGWRAVLSVSHDIDGRPLGRNAALGAVDTGDVRKGSFF